MSRNSPPGRLERINSKVFLSGQPSLALLSQHTINNYLPHNERFSVSRSIVRLRRQLHWLDNFRGFSDFKLKYCFYVSNDRGRNAELFGEEQ